MEKDIEIMKKLTNKVYIIKQNNPSQLKYERHLVCKKKECVSTAKLITFYDTEESYLWICTKEHIENCPFKDQLGNLSEEEKIFEDQKLKILISSTLPPKQVIQVYNKNRKAEGLSELPNVNRVAKKISRYRFGLNLKEKDIQEPTLIVNINELKGEVHRNTFSAEDVKNLSDDTVFVAGSQFIDNKFCIVLTSKILLNRYMIQRKFSPGFLAMDGTYRLNELRYPTLVLGTVDVHRKFHLGNFFFFFIFEPISSCIMHC